MPAPKDTFVNPLLTDISIAYKNESYLADVLFPTVTVNKKTGLYFVADREHLRAPADAHRAEFGRANRVTNKLMQEAFALTEKSLETPISDDVMDMYDDPFDPKSNATNLVSEKLLIDRELGLKAKFDAIVTGAGSNVLDAAGSWSTITTGIAAQIRTGRNFVQLNTGMKANTLLLGKEALDVLLTNTEFKDSIKYTQTLTEEALRNAIANFFDIKRVLIGEAVQNAAKEGQADSMQYIWDDLAVVAYVAPNPAIETPSAGYNLALKDGRYVDEWYEQAIKTTFVRANDYYDDKIVDEGAIYIIDNVKA